MPEWRSRTLRCRDPSYPGARLQRRPQAGQSGENRRPGARAGTYCEPLFYPLGSTLLELR